MTRPQSCLACGPWPSLECVCSFIQQVFPENLSVKKSDHVIPCSEPSLVPAENPNSLFPQLLHTLLPHTSRPLHFLFFLPGVFFPECPVTGSFPSDGTFSEGASWGLPSQITQEPDTAHPHWPSSRTTSSYFLALCHLKFSWLREGVSLAASLLPAVDSEAVGGHRMDTVHLAHCWIPSPITSTQQVLNKCLLTNHSKPGE